MKSGEARETESAAAEVQIQMVSLIYAQVSCVYVLGVFCVYVLKFWGDSNFVYVLGVFCVYGDSNLVCLGTWSR